MKAFTPKLVIGGIVLFLLVVSGFIFFRQESFKNSGPSDPPSDSPTLAANIESSAGVGEYYDGSKSAAASASATPIPKAGPITLYVYPGSKRISFTAVKLEMESVDSATKITDWYKNKIKSLKFNAQSFAASNTNEDIFNKLSAAKPGEKIEVTIKKDQSASKVLITVDRL